MQSEHIKRVREFTRFYTNFIGLLDQTILKTDYSLSEARVLYEIANTRACTAKILAERLSVNKGYLSRIINRFEKKRLLVREENVHDRRVTILKLSRLGVREFNALNKASEKQIARILKSLHPKMQRALLFHMHGIQEILEH